MRDVLGPELNQILLEGRANVEFGGMSFCTMFDGHEMYFDLPALTYNDVDTGLCCAKHHLPVRH